MTTIKPPKALLRQAAELRMAGSTWETVALAVGRAVATVRQWPQRYPALWKELIHLAEQHLLQETTAESVLTLRRQLRSDDEKTSRDAADKLLKFRLAKTAKSRSDSAPAGRSDASRLVRFLEGLSDAQLEELLQQLPDSAPLAADGATAASDSSSTAATESVPGTLLPYLNR